MKIYALKDRLINYYMTPFAAPSDQDVLAGLAQTINSEGKDVLTQAPHHFEIWRLGEVQEDGTLIAKREFIADCTSLIRTGIRRAESQPAGNRPAGTASNHRTSPQGGDREDPGTYPAPMGNSAQEPPHAV